MRRAVLRCTARGDEISLIALAPRRGCRSCLRTVPVPGCVMLARFVSGSLSASVAHHRLQKTKADDFPASPGLQSSVPLSPPDVFLHCAEWPHDGIMIWMPGAADEVVSQ